MPRIEAGNATVYKGIRRRYFTPKAAARDIALRTWIKKNGPEKDGRIEDRDWKVIHRYQRLLLHRFRAGGSDE